MGPDWNVKQYASQKSHLNGSKQPGNSKMKLENGNMKYITTVYGMTLWYAQK